MENLSNGARRFARLSMNEKQAKLLRYYLRYTGDLALVKQLESNWSQIPARKKGRITRWLKKVIVTMMHVKNEKTKYDTQKKAGLALRNMEVLKGF